MTDGGSGPDFAEGQGGQREDSGAGGSDEPGRILGEVRRLRRQARLTRRGYWFPLVLFGVLICTSVPFYVQPVLPRGWATYSSGPYLPTFGGFQFNGLQGYLSIYWIVAIVVGLALTWLWYRQHGRRVGLVTPARASLITGGALLVIALVYPLFGTLPGDLIVRGTFPLVLLSPALWVLARAERSWALLIIAVLYTGAALLASLYNIENILFRLGWTPTGAQWRLTGLPNVLLPALILLIGGIGSLVVQRRQRGVA